MKAIQDKFNKMGADINIRIMPTSREVLNKGWGGRPSYWRTVQLSPPPLAIDIIEGKKESFELRIAADMIDKIDLQVLECVPEQRHLVLLAKVPERVRIPAREFMKRPERTETRISKMHFLCGHDERHWFVAGVQPCSTVREAKTSLKPIEVRELESKSGLRASKAHKRHNEAWIRQGEWFFVASPDLVVNPLTIRKEEPITRGSGRNGGKPHTAQFAVRAGGELVYTKGATVLTEKQYKALELKDQAYYKQMMRNPQLYVKGTVRHLDHETIDLGDVWHRVYMNRERAELRGRSVAFLD